MLQRRIEEDRTFSPAARSEAPLKAHTARPTMDINVGPHREPNNSGARPIAESQRPGRFGDGDGATFLLPDDRSHPGGLVSTDESATNHEDSLLWTLEEIGRLVSQNGSRTETLTNIVHLIQQRFETDVLRSYIPAAGGTSSDVSRL